MSGKNTKRKSRKSGTDWKYLADDSDKGIDFSDIPKLDSGFWEKAKIRIPRGKDSVTIRIDHDVLEWFKKSGKGYQTKINALLRSFMEHATKS